MCIRDSHITLTREWRRSSTSNWRDIIATSILDRWWYWCYGIRCTVDRRSTIKWQREIRYIDRIGIGPNMGVVSTIGIRERIDHVTLTREWRRSRTSNRGDIIATSILDRLRYSCSSDIYTVSRGGSVRCVYETRYIDRIGIGPNVTIISTIGI